MMSSTEPSVPPTHSVRKHTEMSSKHDSSRTTRPSLEVFGGAPSVLYTPHPPDVFASGGSRQGGLPNAPKEESENLAQSLLKQGEKTALVSERSRRAEPSSTRDQVDRWLSTVDEGVAGFGREPSSDFLLDGLDGGQSSESKLEDSAPPEGGIFKEKAIGKDYALGNGGRVTVQSGMSESSHEPIPKTDPRWQTSLLAVSAAEPTHGASGSRDERISGLSEASDGNDARSVPRISGDLKDALASFQQTFVVSDATRPDYPILYASAGFFEMTGYSPKEVIGRNCRFLQGPETDQEDIQRIRNALKDGKTFCGRILNYRKNGNPFWNLLTIAPIKDDNGKILKYIGMQVEVSKYTEGNRANDLRPNGMPSSLIKYDSRQQDRATSSVQELVGALKHPAPTQEVSPPRKSTGGGAPPLFSFPPLRDELELKLPSRYSTQSTASSVKASGNQNVPKFRSKSESVNRTPEDVKARSMGENGGKSQSTRRLSGLMHLIKKPGKVPPPPIPVDDLDLDDSMPNVEDRESLDDGERTTEIRRGMDLATTLERIEKNFVITDPRLPDNPIIFASDHFLELTEYTREEIIGRNCRFLQGPDTDMGVVRKISDAIRNQKNITVQLLNYTKTGKPFWNLFHLEAMKDNKGELQYFIGVQLDGSEHIEPIRRRMSERTEEEGKKIVQSTAKNVDGALRELPDANTSLEDLWANHSRPVLPKPHKRNSSTWDAVRDVLSGGEKLGLGHFRPIKPLGCGDTGSVHLVELRNTTEFYAMKAMEKAVMVNRNKVHRARAEREILEKMDHPFLPTLYGSFQTRTHVCLITDFCPGGELFLLLERQPQKRFQEDAARFYAAEIILALEYLHCVGVVYRDLKPENVLIQQDGHVQLTDFDLSFLTASRPQLYKPAVPSGRRKRNVSKESLRPIVLTEPTARSNSFVGTEEYIAPEIILGLGHNSSVDWWALGILLYEMLFGRTPFRGRNRQRTFANVLHKDLGFPSSIPVSVGAKQVIRGLLHRDPKKRLGSDKGANDLKSHPFFSDINWPLIRCLTPPKLETPVFHIGKEPDTRDLDWDDGDPSAASFNSTF
uniref:non-specific serine/threonine protein kinase n=1 Tax=Pellia sp. BC-2016 TaxID=1799610 RepID=A0A126X0H4_9MARC|nr:putative LOV domain-containing protein [Pellia sp. BC-2016]